MNVIRPKDPNSNQSRVQYVRWLPLLCKYLLLITAIWWSACGDGNSGSSSYPCGYPTGPYAFNEVGDVVPPMRWTGAVTGADEISSADLADLRCQPSVHSVFIHVGATYCPTCPERLRAIQSGMEDWEAYGAKWIFLVIDAETGEAASEYVDRHGITFGWRANDADNTMGADAVAHAEVVEFQPWVGVIRVEDMVLVFSESVDEAPDLVSVARELAGEEGE